MCQLADMDYFNNLSDDDPPLANSPLLRAAQLTLQYTQDNGSIELTKTKAFKRKFVHWAAKHFDWPGMGYDELFRVNKVLNEYDFVPLELLHFLLIERKLGRHYKGAFKLTKRGTELAKLPAKLFVELIPFYLFQIDHGAYSRLGDYPEGNWDVWLNVLNVEVENGAKEAALYKVFYGEPEKGPMSWRKTGPFYSCVLRPLSWAGLLSQPEVQNKPSSEKDYFKTPLWRSALKLETDRLVQPAQRH